MKKGFLFLAGSAILFASCGSNNNSEAPSKAQVDSSVNAQVAAKEAAMKAQNDSTIAAQAKAKADSEMIAKDAVAKEKEKEHHTGGGHHTTPAAATPVATPTVAPTPANPKDARFQTGNSTAPTQQQIDNAKKKADRFKN